MSGRQSAGSKPRSTMKSHIIAPQFRHTVLGSGVSTRLSLYHSRPPAFAASPVSSNSHARPTTVISDRDPSKKAKVNNTIPPSVLMTTFLDHWASHVHEEILAHEAGPPNNHCCRCSTHPSSTSSELPPLIPTFYRCFDCYHPPWLCQSCIVANHQTNPFHHVQKWDPLAGFLERIPLHTLGLEIFLGHHGTCCPRANPSSRPMTLVHEHGIHPSAVRFCECPDPTTQARMPDPIQLLRFGLFPGSWDTPRSAYSLHLLRNFHLLSLQSKINAHDFCTYLARLTNNIFPDRVKDRYREFMTAVREYSYLRAVRRSGVEPGRRLPAGALAIRCPACPQLGINMTPSWRARPPSLQFLDALFYAVDGNFHANQKEKPMDENDFPLSLGAAYFANEDEFAKYQKSLGPPAPEPTTCHKFGAMGYGAYGGRVSGTVGLFCARHMFALPSASVDLQKGERYANVDFATISGLQLWMPLLRHVSGYDINCQYCKNFDKRMAFFEEHKNDYPSIQCTYFPWTLRGVGKFHLPAHKPTCRWKFSFYYLPGVGMTDGEAAERIWVILNSLSLSTREMSPGHRHDIINDHHSDMNVRKMHSMAYDLCQKHERACEYAKQSEEDLVTTEDSIEQEKVDAWRGEESQWLKSIVDHRNHSKMSNPYEPRQSAVPTQKQVIERLHQEPSSGKLPITGLLGHITEGLELEKLQRKIQDFVNQDDSSSSLRATSSRVELGRMRETLAERLDAWLDEDVKLISPLIQEAANDLGVSELANSPLRPISPSDNVVDGVDHARIALPSHYDIRIIQHPCFLDVVRLETQLRQGEANDALNDLRMHLITGVALLHKRSQLSGQKSNTRSKAALSNQRNATSAAAAAYRSARESLLALGMDPDDCTYQKLTQEDVRPFVVYSHHEKLGQSKTKASWIWGDLSFVENEDQGAMKGYCEEVVRAHWFRKSALRARWGEEVVLLEEEMRRTLRFFLSRQHAWTKTAVEPDQMSSTEGRVAYAKRQANRFEQLATAARELFQGKIETDEVLAEDDNILNNVD